jgi:hypothetical protein
VKSVILVKVLFSLDERGLRAQMNSKLNNDLALRLAGQCYRVGIHTAYLTTPLCNLDTYIVESLDLDRYKPRTETNVAKLFNQAF